MSKVKNEQHSCILLVFHCFSLGFCFAFMIRPTISFSLYFTLHFVIHSFIGDETHSVSATNSLFLSLFFWCAKNCKFHIEYFLLIVYSVCICCYVWPKLHMLSGICYYSVDSFNMVTPLLCSLH